MYTDVSGCSVYYGSVDWNIMKTQKIKALKYIVHPEYVTGANDIALIELNETLKFSEFVQPLNETLKFSEFVQPVCLDHNVDPLDDEILTHCGMGSDFKKRLTEGFSHDSHNILQDAPIQHINPSICGSDEKRKICAGGVNHVALPGDSGGPLMVIRREQWIQIGVLSGFGWHGFENESLSIHAIGMKFNLITNRNRF
uniref:Peptidase S1 domain-containing protein n=1 Tax=Panagrolaimus sp. ES5 TaxID=591445 RepID=A0AC34GQF2_9BILA